MKGHPFRIGVYALPLFHLRDPFCVPFCGEKFFPQGGWQKPLLPKIGLEGLVGNH